MFLHKISLLGKRPSNEDAEYYLLNLDGNDKTKRSINLLAIFDGHGGPLISKYLTNNLLEYFYNKDIIPQSIKPHNLKYHKFIQKLYNFIQEKIRNEIKESRMMGSTALIAQIYNHKGINRLQIINAGDCRAVICNKYNIGTALTKDHKPTTFEEHTRITQMGGQIMQLPNDDPRIMGLSVSRSLGDVDAKPYVSHQPEIFDYVLDMEDKFLILGCDGLWDVFDNQSAVDFVLGEMKKNDYKINIDTNNLQRNIAKKIAEKAIEKGSTDNVSCLMLFFR